MLRLRLIPDSRARCATRHADHADALTQYADAYVLAYSVCPVGLRLEAIGRFLSLSQNLPLGFERRESGGGQEMALRLIIVMIK